MNTYVQSWMDFKDPLNSRSSYTYTCTHRVVNSKLVYYSYSDEYPGSLRCKWWHVFVHPNYSLEMKSTNQNYRFTKHLLFASKNGCKVIFQPGWCCNLEGIPS